MVAFTIKLEADLSGAAFPVSAPTWTDITRFLRSTPNITKIRQDELTTVAPSTMSGLILDNADLPGDPTAPNAGRFTPGLSTSPWTGKIVPDVRIRYSITVGGTTYVRFDGYVDEWAASASDDFPICSVTASDWLARAGTMPLRSMMQETVIVDLPRVYVPLTDAEGATVPAVVVNDTSVLSASLVSTKSGAGTVTFAGGDGPPPEGTKALLLAQPTSARGTVVKVPVTLGFHAGAPGRGLTLRVNYTGTTVLGGYLVVLGSPAGTNMRISIDALGAPTASCRTIAAVSPAQITDGNPHDLVADLVWTGAGTVYTMTLYVDGLSVATDTGSLPTDIDFTYFEVGGQVDWFSQGPVTSGTYSHAAVYNRAHGSSPAVNVIDHVSAAVTGFGGGVERTDQHVARLLSFRANLGSTLDVGDGVVGVHSIAGVTLQQALLDTAKAEGGLLFVNPADGKITFYGRKRLRDPAVTYTLDASLEQVGLDTTARIDRQQMVNDASIDRPNGPAQRVTTGDPLVASFTDTYIVFSDQDSHNAAGLLVANGKAPATRSPTAGFDVTCEPTVAVAQAVLALMPWQRLALSNPPSWMAAGDVIIQGVQDSIGPLTADIEFFTSPLPRTTLRFDAVASAYTKLDATPSANVFAW